MAAQLDVHNPSSAGHALAGGGGPSDSQPGDNNIKLSRYRSVRKAQLKQSQEDAPPESIPPVPAMPETAPVQASIQRSMSRYHRRGAPSQTTSNAHVVPPLPSKAPIKTPTSRDGVHSHHSSPHSAAKVSRPQPNTPADDWSRKPRAHRVARQDEDVPQGTLLEQQARRRAPVPMSSEGEQVLANERARYERIKAQQRAERAERDKVLEAQRREKEKAEEEIRRVEREKAEEQERIRRAKEEEHEREVREKAEAKLRAKEERAARKRRPTDATVQTQESRHTTSRGSVDSPASSKRVGGLFRRKRDEEGAHPLIAVEDGQHRRKHTSPPRLEQPTIKPGGGGIVPLSDAPVSGVVGAERRVRIRFGRSEITLPAEPTTTALQLIRSASTVMSESFNPREAILYEYYQPQGVRRPLRMYEHVRNVMNSWEDDSQNYLMIEVVDPEGFKELYDRHAPEEEQLKQYERPLMYQHKAGKWDDRWITLREDGQITAAKNQAGKDMVTVCHLSDFDIYTPVPDVKRRKKPSRKVVLSIKSQQKSAMFLDKSTYIHHFCSEDKAIADQFFRAVQDWRSYYLVNRMGQGPASKDTLLPAAQGKAGHMRSKSAESHYLLGSFNDLGLDFTDYARPPPSPPKRQDSFDENRPLAAFGMLMPSAQEHSRTVHQRQLSQHRDRSRNPPTAMRHGIPSKPGGRDDALRALNGNVRQSWSSGNGAFDPNSLLGAGYEQRLQHASRPSQDGLRRNTSVRSTLSQQRRASFDSATGLGRTASTRRPPPDFGKPLLDFTPQYKEPPQFARRGKAFRPDGPGGALIENATSPENHVQGMPGSADWRARPAAPSGGLDRAKSVTRSKSTRRPNRESGPSDEAFTGGGLLAQNKGWGGGQSGHGVVSAVGAGGGPMLNMNEPSAFGEGSLLRRMEMLGVEGNGVARET